MNQRGETEAEAKTETEGPLVYTGQSPSNSFCISQSIVFSGDETGKQQMNQRGETEAETRDKNRKATWFAPDSLPPIAFLYHKS